MLKKIKKNKILIISLLISIIFIVGIITTILVVKKTIKEPKYYTVNTNYLFNNQTSYDLTFDIYSTEKVDKYINEENFKEANLLDLNLEKTKLELKEIVKEEKVIKTKLDELYLYQLKFNIPSILIDKYKIYQNAKLEYLTKNSKAILFSLGNVEIIDNNIFTNQQYLTVNYLKFDSKEIKDTLAPKKINIKLNDGYSVNIKEIRFGFLENEKFDFYTDKDGIVLNFKPQNMHLSYLTIFFVLTDGENEIIQRHQQGLNYDISYQEYFNKAKELNYLNIVF